MSDPWRDGERTLLALLIIGLLFLVGGCLAVWQYGAITP